MQQQYPRTISIVIISTLLVGPAEVGCFCVKQLTLLFRGVERLHGYIEREERNDAAKQNSSVLTSFILSASCIPLLPPKTILHFPSSSILFLVKHYVFQRLPNL